MVGMVNYQRAQRTTIALSALCACLGLALFVMTTIYLSRPTFITEYVSIYGIKAVCAYGLGLSFAVMGSSALVLVAGLQNNVRLLKIGIGVVIFVVLFDTVCVILAFVMRFKVNEDVNDQIYSIMKKYGQEEYPRETDTWDFFQMKMECCGSRGPDDWQFTPFVTESGGEDDIDNSPILITYVQNIPRSCCKSYASTTPFDPECQEGKDKKLFYSRGCSEVVNQLSWAFSGSVAAVLIVAAICQFFFMLSSWSMVKELTRDKEDYVFAPAPSTAPRTAQAIHGGGTIRSNASYNIGGNGTYSSNRRLQYDAPGSQNSSLRSDRGGMQVPPPVGGRVTPPSENGSMGPRPPPPSEYRPAPRPISENPNEEPEDFDV